MERSNQPPKTECCREEGQVPEATEASGPNDLWEAYTGKLTGRKQDSHPAKATQPRDGAYMQAGTESPFTEPHTSPGRLAVRFVWVVHGFGGGIQMSPDS